MSDVFDGSGSAVRTVIGVRDPVIERMAATLRRELSYRSAGGRLYIEGLGSALAVHLFRAYGDGLKRVPPVIGGLGARLLRRVFDCFKAHLADHISLRDLAAAVALRPRHFGEAFEASPGTPSHRYLIEQRIW